jgi:hypothetical protein
MALQGLAQKNLNDFPTVASRAQVEVGNAMVAAGDYKNARAFFQKILDDGNGGDASQLHHITVTDVGINFSLKAILQGAYNGTDMSDDLRSRKLLPTEEPYTERGHIITSDHTLDPALLDTTGTNAIVDWVVIQVRDSNDASIILTSWAALLQRNGDIVHPSTGSHIFRTDDIVAGDYHLAIGHRNHTSAMSMKLTLGAVHITADFSDANYPTYGNEARLITGDTAVLWAGDANHDGQIIAQGNGNDLNILLGNILGHAGNSDVNTNYILEGYLDSDINMDGDTIFSGVNNDVNHIIGNILLHSGNTTMSSNYIITQQVP